MSSTHVNDAGIELIMRNEGCKLKAYLCPAGIWTIGYGCTGPDIIAGLVITQAQAERMLLDRLAGFCSAVTGMVKVKLSENQFSALVSLAFNIGSGALSKSTLIRKLNAGDYDGAAAEFDKWNKAGGKVLPGLVIRRAAERHLFECGS